MIGFETGRAVLGGRTALRPSGRLHVRRLAAAVAVTLAVLAAMWAGAASAQTAKLRLSPEDRRQIERIESYLNDLETVQSRFVQVSSNGQMAEGDFYLWRPGRLRIEYDPPVPVLIVTSGRFIVYFDRELEQVSHVPVGSTPVALLTEEDVSLQGPDLTITGFERRDGLLEVTVVQAGDPLEGSVTLVFTEDPLHLRKWSVVDAQGVRTDVTLVGTRFDVPLNPDLFEFRDPRFFRDDF